MIKKISFCFHTLQAFGVKDPSVFKKKLKEIKLFFEKDRKMQAKEQKAREKHQKKAAKKMFQSAQKEHRTP